MSWSPAIGGHCLDWLILQVPYAAVFEGDPLVLRCRGWQSHLLAALCSAVVFQKHIKCGGGDFSLGSIFEQLVTARPPPSLPSPTEFRTEVGNWYLLK